MYGFNLRDFPISSILSPPTVNLTMRTDSEISTAQPVLIYIHLSWAQNVVLLLRKVI